MNYADVYFSRVFHLGESTNEIAKNSNIRSFERWLANSPFTVDDLSVERGLYFSGIIQTNKDRDEKKLMLLYVANDIPIKVGDILNWQQDDGEIEKWILLSKEQKVNGAYQTFSIIKCNYLIKWIDGDGRVKKTWSYVVSSTDDKIKGNFRTWHNLITPQPNKYAEIIIPRIEIDRGTTFIIEDEAWVLVESDFTSVKGIQYMSLTESKVNYQYDDREVDIAETDKLKFPTLEKLYTVGAEIVPNFGEDTWNEWEIEMLIPDECPYASFNEDGHLFATAAGQFIVQMQLKNRPAVRHQYEITINAPETQETLYIAGADTIRLDRYETYSLVNENEKGISDVSFELILDENEKVPLAQISGLENKEIEYTDETRIVKLCTIHANKKNKLGDFVLVAHYNGVDYTKTIKIIPLW